MIGNCPKCGDPVKRVSIENVIAVPGTGEAVPAISFCCQNCLTILSVQIDPTVVVNDIVQQVRMILAV